MAKPSYSSSLAGYNAWLADGNIGTPEEFRQQVKRGSAQWLRDQIRSILDTLNVEELQQVLSLLQSRF